MEWTARDAWEDNFLQGEAFYKEHGYLEVPAQLVTESGLWLNKWLSVQRRAYGKDH